MNAVTLASLPWLPAAPADFRAQCQALETSGNLGRDLKRLLNTRLDANQLVRVAKLLKALPAARIGQSGLTPLRLGLLSNGTIDLILPAIAASSARHGVYLETIKSPFGQHMQQSLDPSSELHHAKPDVVLLALDHRAFTLRAPLGNRNVAENVVDAAVQTIRGIVDGIQAGCGAAVILSTIAPPAEPIFGSFDTRTPGTLRWMIAELNQKIVGLAAETGNFLLDVCFLAESIGLDQWHDPVQWNLAKISFSMSLVPLYADYVARLAGSIRGKSRKCLVLDLDNTLWGGVIGDDGLDGIALGQGSAIGEAHLAVQRLALNLHERGIILAVCSKNDEANARLPFQKHPEMLLKEDHIAVFQANWRDKASNLEAIATHLNIGVDSLVFLDDNPAERAQVREALPQVAVPEIPADPAHYPRLLALAGYFEAVAFSDDDRARGAQYRDNVRRAAMQSQARDLNSYLNSLEMVAHLTPFDSVGRSRIAQLINKSNQFNLTTRRYTEQQVAEMADDPGLWTLQVRLVDTFGDNGMISVIVCRMEKKVWEVDTWLMSCRVLGRRVEQCVLNEIAVRAQEAGAHRVIGRYLPTEKNGLVRDHYKNLGFQWVQQSESETVWELELAAFTPFELPMEVQRRTDADEATMNRPRLSREAA